MSFHPRPNCLHHETLLCVERDLQTMTPAPTGKASCFVSAFPIVCLSRLWPCLSVSRFTHLDAPLSLVQRCFALRSRRRPFVPLPSDPHRRRSVLPIACEKALSADSSGDDSRLGVPSIQDRDIDNSSGGLASTSHSQPVASLPPKPTLKESYSADERRARSERLRSLWQDPEWRASMLAKRRSKESVRRKSEKLKAKWSNPDWRDKMCQARIGRPAPNKGITPSKATRLRMSMARRGKPKSALTRQRMSIARRKVAENDDWRKVISESKTGKTRQYYALRREFSALYRDLKLWSDSYKARFGRLPHPNTFQTYVAPMMVFRIRRYLILRDTLGIESAGFAVDIFSS